MGGDISDENEQNLERRVCDDNVYSVRLESAMVRSTEAAR